MKKSGLWINSTEKFGLCTRFFHLCTLLMVLCSFSFIYYRWTLTTTDDLFVPLILWHKALGPCIFVMALLLLGSVRLVGLRPRWPLSMPAYERVLARMVHAGLYLCLFLMPLTGYFMSAAAGYSVSVFGWFLIEPVISKNEALSHLLFDCHQWTSYGFLACMAFHLIGALKHHWVDKNNLLTRMF